jgi:hypothetical protein
MNAVSNFWSTLTDSNVRTSGAVYLTALSLVGLGAAGCGDTAAETGSATILPHQSPASFGEMYPLGNNDPDSTGNLRTPFEWVLLLQSKGDGPLKISQVCLVGDEDDGSGVNQFSLEVEDQELPATVAPGDDFGMRLTYNRQEPNVGDDADQIAVVVQSNASDFPTLIVPVCSRVIADGEDRGSVECQSPVQVAKGESNTDLCN